MTTVYVQVLPVHKKIHLGLSKRPQNNLITHIRVKEVITFWYTYIQNWLYLGNIKIIQLPILILTSRNISTAKPKKNSFIFYLYKKKKKWYIYIQKLFFLKQKNNNWSIIIF